MQLDERDRNRSYSTRQAVRIGAALLSACLAALVASYAVRPPGPQLTFDGVVYVGAAENLAAGKGFSIPFGTTQSPDSVTPLAHWPPGYPALLALGIGSGATPLATARIINVLSAALIALLATLILADAAPLWWATAGGASMALSSAVGARFADVASELPFVALTLAAVLLMVRVPRRPLGYGAFAAAALSIRYAGAGVVFAAVLWAMLWAVPGRRRAWAGLTALLPAAGFLAIWSVFKPEGGTVRHAGLFLSGYGAALHELARVMGRWLVPLTVPVGLPARTLIAAMLCVGIAAAAAVALRKSGAIDDPRRVGVLAVCSLVVAGILGVTLAARLIADPAINFDDRITYPALVGLQLASFAALGTWDSTLSQRRRRARWAARGLVLCWLYFGARSTFVSIDLRRIDPNAFGNPAYAHQQVVRWVNENGADYRLFSNNTALLWLHAHRSAFQLPTSASPAGDLSRTTDALRDSRTLVAWIGSGETCSDSVSIGATRAVAALCLGDGFIATANHAAAERLRGAFPRPAK